MKHSATGFSGQIRAKHYLVLFGLLAFISYSLHADADPASVVAIKSGIQFTKPLQSEDAKLAVIDFIKSATKPPLDLSFSTTTPCHMITKFVLYPNNPHFVSIDTDCKEDGQKLADLYAKLSKLPPLHPSSTVAFQTLFGVNGYQEHQPNSDTGLVEAPNGFVTREIKPYRGTFFAPMAWTTIEKPTEIGFHYFSGPHGEKGFTSGIAFQIKVVPKISSHGRQTASEIVETSILKYQREASKVLKNCKEKKLAQLKSRCFHYISKLKSGKKEINLLTFYYSDARDVYAVTSFTAPLEYWPQVKEVFAIISKISILHPDSFSSAAGRGAEV